MCAFTVALKFDFHKSVQKLYHNLNIIFSNSLIGFKVICQLEKEPLKGLANVQEIFSKTIFFCGRLTVKVSRTAIHII